MIDKICYIFARLIDLFRLPRSCEKGLLLSGRIASEQNKSAHEINTLQDAEFRVFSQWGEDGIIDWLLHNLPSIPESFVEFGVENYQESNTRFLLQHRHWRGLVFDSSAANINQIQRSELYWRHDLSAVEAFITRDNINSLIADNGFAGEIGILSIDLDGNDYWIFDAINCVDPAVIVCEYNGVFGDEHAISIPYDEGFSRQAAHYSGQYFGASIAALKSLAARKGYSFLGSGKSGVNAFFVRENLMPSITKRIGQKVAYPSQHRDSRNADGALTYISGEARADAIGRLPVAIVKDDTTAALDSLGSLYSPKWRSGNPS